MALDYDVLAVKKYPVGSTLEGPIRLTVAKVESQFQTPFVSLREVVYHSPEGLFYEARSVLIMPECMLIIPILPDGRIVMVCVLRPGINAWCWEMPQERMDREADGTFEAAAIRCAREEVGLIGEPRSFRYLTPVATMPDRVTEITYPVVVEGEFDFAARTDKKEVPEGAIQAFTKAQVTQMILDGLILCPCAISAFFKMSL